MLCPECAGDCVVVESRDVARSNVIRRRRECNACGYRWTTYEGVATKYRVDIDVEEPVHLRLEEMEKAVATAIQHIRYITVQLKALKVELDVIGGRG